MEFFGGLSCLIFGLGSVALVIRFGRPAAHYVAIFATVVQFLIIGSLWLDWGYSWVERSAISVVLDKSVWMALPQAGAIVIIIGFLSWGLRFVPYGAALAGIQAAATLPGLFLAEMSTDTSFLGIPALFVMFGSTLSAFMFTASSLVILPQAGYRWYRVVFGPRLALMDAIAGLSASGFSIKPPQTVFESGSAKGQRGSLAVSLTTRPSLRPLLYGLRIEFAGPDALLVDVPGFAANEKIANKGGVVIYQGLTAKSFEVDGDSLSTFIDVVAASASASPK